MRMRCGGHLMVFGLEFGFTARKEGRRGESDDLFGTGSVGIRSKLPEGSAPCRQRGCSGVQMLRQALL